MATAVAGSILGIHPFDQPDVEASKTATQRLTAAYEASGSLPTSPRSSPPTGSPLRRSGERRGAGRRRRGAAVAGGFLAAHLDRVRPGDYFALLAYLEMSAANERGLAVIRDHVLASRHVATCLGFGPRFLHSTVRPTGGPNTGVFLQFTCDDAVDVAVPGQLFTFGVVKAAQARGDFAVLAQRGRRVLRVHLGAVSEGLAALKAAVVGR